jgi:putative nucleotidyltransferase with HDIG domain
LLRETDSHRSPAPAASASALIGRAFPWDRGLWGFVIATEARLPCLKGHARRVASISRLTGEALGMGGRDVLRVERGALVHDVGKMIVPTEILEAPRKLTLEEFEQVERHTTFGARVVDSFGDPVLTSIVRHHHERLDGSGYPDGLPGPAITLGARIVAVADTFDALTSGRPYRKAGSIPEAIEIIEAEAGRTLDLDVVTAFLSSRSGRMSHPG